MKVRIGVLGCSSFAKRLFIPNALAFGKIEIVGVASRSKEKADEYAALFNCQAFYTYEAILNDQSMDAIYMPLPISMHKEWMIAALKAGKHVLVEKSFTESLADTREVLELAKAKQLCVFENFMFPYHSQIQIVKDALQTGKIGTLRQLKSSFGFPQFDADSNIRYKKSLGGGALLDAGAYTLMAAQIFLGTELEVIGASLNNMSNEVDFDGTALLTNKEGVSGLLSFGFDHFYQNNIELWGSKGRIVMKRAFTAGPGIKPVVEIESAEGIESIECAADNHFFKMFEVFVKGCTGSYDLQYEQLYNQSRLITEIVSKAKYFS
ncbi:MAG TPA: Gfo/Idh/MocA family oxidoreductase [Phnomibacter sp.]|nr:Gfo/Idh/MocA family oxidoreductase [Phnomibacter sp.]